MRLKFLLFIFNVMVTVNLTLVQPTTLCISQCNVDADCSPDHKCHSYSLPWREELSCNICEPKNMNMNTCLSQCNSDADCSPSHECHSYGLPWRPELSCNVCIPRRN